MHKIVTETVAIVEKIVKNGKVEHMEQKRMEQRKMWNSGMGEEKNKCGVFEKVRCILHKNTK